MNRKNFLLLQLGCATEQTHADHEHCFRLGNISYLLLDEDGFG
jgi:hypothetical protein